jgi:hypothetical protein
MTNEKRRHTKRCQNANPIIEQLKLTYKLDRYNSRCQTAYVIHAMLHAAGYHIKWPMWMIQEKRNQAFSVTLSC